MSTKCLVKQDILDLPLNQWYEKGVDDDDWNVTLSDWLRSHSPDITTVEKYLPELDNFTTIDDNLVATETSLIKS
ncbi:unnamed protein product [Acanthoscelides obtectus]|uniref:Uncharacterized protein n=1 Tax=Acanthoscelides obtectus TaxID=200917 RepID=A0A9P0NV86_ACAOB|nr:unnamed protein product [Acanthoscelides obtectus]CAK1649884.1 hypothetical protein AOBTE_LOCUS16474 [Acanthoscelides obtectus]